MNLKWFLSAFTSNYKAKIVAIVCAAFLWIHVTAQRVEDQSFRVPLEFKGVTDSLTIVNEVPEGIEVTIKETRVKLIKLRLIGNIRAIVDLSMARVGWMNIPLSSSVIQTDKDINPRNIMIDNPKFLSLNFRKVVTKSVPVKLAFKGGIREKSIIVKDPVIMPERVTISGASTIIEDIGFLSTREIDIRNRTGLVRKEVGFFTEGYDIKVDPEKVVVELQIDKRTVRTLANIPPTILVDNEDLQVGCSPPAASITIEGPESVLDDIVSSDISIILNISNASPGEYSVKPEVIVPEGIERHWLDTDSFVVTVSADSAGAEGRK